MISNQGKVEADWLENLENLENMENLEILDDDWVRRSGTLVCCVEIQI